MMRLGAQMYTVRDFCKTEDGLRDALKKVRAMGYETVQLSGHGPGISDEAIRAMLDETGLVCAATHIPFGDMQADMEGVIKKHRLWGCEYAGVGSMPGAYAEGALDAESFKRFAADATIVARALKDAGLTFIYHNHQFEFMRFGGKSGMEILFEECGPEVQFELDTYWVQTGGGDVVHWINKARGRVDVIHFKEMTIAPDRTQQMTEIGYGNLNWDGIFEACKSSGVRYALVEQDVCQIDPFESLERSLGFLRGKGLK